MDDGSLWEGAVRRLLEVTRDDGADTEEVHKALDACIAIRTRAYAQEITESKKLLAQLREKERRELNKQKSWKSSVGARLTAKHKENEVLRAEMMGLTGNLAQKAEQERTLQRSYDDLLGQVDELRLKAEMGDQAQKDLEEAQSRFNELTKKHAKLVRELDLAAPAAIQARVDADHSHETITKLEQSALEWKSRLDASNSICDALRARNDQLELENSRLKDLLDDEKQHVETQSRSYKAKLEAVDNKYQNVKDINIGLSKWITELRARLPAE